jgi:hypothetical protein
MHEAAYRFLRGESDLVQFAQTTTRGRLSIRRKLTQATLASLPLAACTCFELGLAWSRGASVPRNLPMFTVKGSNLRKP